MRIKQRPGDFVVRESWRFDPDPHGEHYVYLMDKQKLSTFEAVDRIALRFGLSRADITYCGLKDKQGRTEQIVAVRGKRVDQQEPDLRLKFLGRSADPLSSANITSNRFAVTVRDLSHEDSERIPESVRELERVGLVNYFDSQRFGFLKHQRRFIAKDLVMDDAETALKAFMATPSRLDKTEDAKVKAFWAEHWGQWTARCPYKGVAKYRHILRRLREKPRDFAHALESVESRTRAMIVFEYQSYLWNETVKAWLGARVPPKDLLQLRYQAGVLVFPRALPAGLDLAARTAPLLAPETRFTDPEIAAAAHSILARERLTLDRLRIPRLPRMFFKHEERPIGVSPGRISVSNARQDEENRGRLKVNLAFTMPPGSYASLLVKRVLWWGETTGENREEKAVKVKVRSPQRGTGAAQKRWR